MNARLAACAAAAAATVVLVPAGPAQAHDEPTCADVDVLGIVVHGQHIVRDYVVGGSIAWPPAGSVGQAVGGAGPAVEGGPGIKKHPVAPGASFCNPQSQSPGFHVPG